MTGYRGRFSIVEVLAITPEVERRIGAGETAERIADAARQNGMKSLWDSGLAHVLRGESTIDELLRVVDVPQEDEFRSASAPSQTQPSSKRDSQPVAEPPRSRLPHTTSGPNKVPEAPPLPVSDKFDLLDVGAPASGRRESTSVLLVDDEDQLRRVMKDLLEREGYTVTEARDGVEALDQVDRHAPNIIVLDLNLPGLDGYGVLSHLRSRPATAKIPVVVLTARGDEESEVRVFEAGADDFLSKPFRARALSARLEAVLRRARATSA
jgi:CheY-like chemotaxis protein